MKQSARTFHIILFNAMEETRMHNQDDLCRWIELAIIAKTHAEMHCDLCGNTGRTPDFRLCDCVRRYPYLSGFIRDIEQ